MSILNKWKKIIDFLRVFSLACVNQIAKDTLIHSKYSNKFLATVNDVANEFLNHLTEESNKVTLSKNKAKMVPDDIFKALENMSFPVQKIEEFKLKMKEFEDTEKVTSKEEKREKGEVD